MSFVRVVFLIIFLLGNVQVAYATTPAPMTCKTSYDCGGGALPCYKKKGEKMGVCVLPPGKRWADEAPISSVTVGEGVEYWVGGPGAIPGSKDEPCKVETPSPGVLGSTNKLPPWLQDRLDRIRASMKLGSGAGTAWYRISATPTHGYARVGCFKAMQGAATAEPVTEPRIAITQEPQKVAINHEGTMTVPESDTHFGARVSLGVELVGPDMLATLDIAFQFLKSWYLMEADVSVAWDNQDDTKRSIGWTVGLRPIGGWFGAWDISLALRGGESSRALTDYSDEVRLGAGVSVAFRPLWWLDNWASELIELRAEVLGAQIYHKGDDFDSADWAPWTRFTVGIKASW